MKAKHNQKHGQEQPTRSQSEASEEAHENIARGDDLAGDEPELEAGTEGARPAAGGEPDDEGAQQTDGAPSPAEAAADAASRAELEAYRDRYLRLAAEYDNFRKRTERERAELSARSQGQLVERILEAVDDLQRVAQLDPERTSGSAVLEGVQLVERKLLRALETAGLETVDAEGQPFNPEVHEALAMVAADDREQDDTVADVFQKGYLFKGHLLRPARVRVRRYEG